MCSSWLTLRMNRQNGEKTSTERSPLFFFSLFHPFTHRWEESLMLKDILGQAWEAMLYNRRRTAITMIGMAWGITTVVLLLAYGAGFGRAIETIFAQFGTNKIGFVAGRTSEQAGGDKAGVWVNLTLDDVDRAANGVPGIFL